MRKYVVDTHALLWFLSGSQQLSVHARSILSSPESQLIIPAIVLAEAVWITRNRKAPAVTSDSVVAAVHADKRISVYQLDIAVVERTMRLDAITEMHDRQIVATALVLQEAGEEIALVTCDRNITASNRVPIAW